MTLPEVTITHDASRYKDFVETVSKLALAIAVACYVLGILVVHRYLKQFGDFNITLLQVDYVMTGALFLLTNTLPATVWLTLFKLSELFRELREKYGGKIIIEFIAFLLAYSIWIGIITTVMTILKGQPETYGPVSGFNLTIALLFNSLFVCAASLSAYLCIQAINNATKAHQWRMWYAIASVPLLAISITLLLTSMYLYAVAIHPKLEASYGGGIKGEVILVPYPEKIPQLIAAGLRFSAEKRSDGPLWILYESSDSLVVTDDIRNKEKKAIKAIQLRKDLFAAILYLRQGHKSAASSPQVLPLPFTFSPSPAPSIPIQSPALSTPTPK